MAPCPDLAGLDLRLLPTVVRPSPRRSLHATGNMPFERRVRAFPGKRDMRGVVRGGRPSCCWPVGAPCGCSMSPRNVDVGRTLAARARASCHRAHRRSISKLRPRRARVAVVMMDGALVRTTLRCASVTAHIASAPRGQRSHSGSTRIAQVVRRHAQARSYACDSEHGGRDCT